LYNCLHVFGLVPARSYCSRIDRLDVPKIPRRCATWQTVRLGPVRAPLFLPVLWVLLEWLRGWF
jgi:hypothetical protein